MLAGLFLAGLMAVVITPMLIDADMEEDEDVMEPEIDDAGRDVGIIDAGMEAEPVFHEFDDVSGKHVLDGFRPGFDRLSVTLDSWELDLTEVTGGVHGPALRFGSFSDSTILIFPGLATIPSTDIDLVIAEPDTDPVTITFAEASEALAGLGDGALQPIDPETPDADPGAGLALDPIFPTAPDTPDEAANEPVDGTPLQPILDNDPVHEPMAAMGADTTYLASSDWYDGKEPSVFQDFDPGENILTLTVNMVPGDEPPVVEVAASANGTDGVVQVNGQTVAILPGAAGMSEDDVVVKIRGLNAA